ncbi:DUF4199 domain-containing protein [Exilibacterium tricleocarpae]|uniref:DUF4199 domain-containing protein n=1 Tax=Exilibacterium tricleocarpae TaxID=2591008 RepID=UPI0015D20307|nr:DUF4199 domain-containing protein [Exilibacterium tricleocarpae]
MAFHNLAVTYHLRDYYNDKINRINLEAGMSQIAIKWGLIAGLVMVGVPLITYLLIGGGPETFAIGEIIGYATIILSLLLIFIAINEFRRLQPDQKVGFGRGLAIGLLISAIAGSLFGIYNWVYVEFLHPEFMDQYYDYYIEQVQQSGKPAAEIEQQIASFEQQKALFMNPVTQFLLMFLTVFVIGAVVSLFCAAVQSRMSAKDV